ncbi:MAG: MMPL family transporter [Oscillospiraceae bacterium]|nr:MMPL family transporter [Oscillospiraceae bacterium]
MSKNQGSFFERVATFIVDKRKWIYAVYIAAFAACLFGMTLTKVENDVTKYLPETTETRQGIEAMNANFLAPGTARIMVSNVTVNTAQKINDQLAAVKGVQMVTFSGDEKHYKDANALFDVTLNAAAYDPAAIETMENIMELLAPYDSHVDTSVGLDENANLRSEMTVIFIIAAVLGLTVLTLTSRSFAEIPILIITFGAAAVMNMGTNFIFGKISFISDSVAVVLQLALSIDYAIILCHRFSDEHEILPVREACIAALSKAIPEISASSLTTISGLMALGFMKFSVGLDMAMVLIKAVLLSLLSVFTLMPGLLVLFAPLIDKTRHKKLLPDMNILGKIAAKSGKIITPAFAVLLVAGFVLSNACPYCYSFTDLKTAKMADRQVAYFEIKEVFGASNMAALVVPSGNYEAESQILKELEAYDEVESTMGLSGIEAMNGYTLTDALTPREVSELMGLDYELAQALYTLYAASENQIGQLINGVADYKIPLFDLFIFLQENLDTYNLELGGMDGMDIGGMLAQLESAKSQLQNDKYSRMVVYLNLPEEGRETYDFLQTIRDVIGRYYEDDYYVVGTSTNSRDMANFFATDNLVISMLTILFVVIVLLFTFKSVGLAAILVMVIQGSIWINFSIPTLTGTPLYFLGYLIANAIMMGANIDYAIVISSHYQANRKTMQSKEAIIKAVSAAFPTVFTSGSIMAAAGLLIGGISAQPVVSIMGTCIGRGTIISILLVLFVLPALLVFFDKIIQKTKFGQKTQTGGAKHV